jgi:hypothetical protein
VRVLLHRQDLFHVIQYFSAPRVIRRVIDEPPCLQKNLPQARRLPPGVLLADHLGMQPIQLARKLVVLLGELGIERDKIRVRVVPEPRSAGQAAPGAHEHHP